MGLDTKINLILFMVSSWYVLSVIVIAWHKHWTEHQLAMLNVEQSFMRDDVAAVAAVARANSQRPKAKTARKKPAAKRPSTARKKPATKRSSTKGKTKKKTKNAQPTVGNPRKNTRAKS